MKTHFAFMAVILLAGCGYTRDDPKDFQPSGSSSDTGRVWLYRMQPRMTMGLWQKFSLDGRWEGEVTPHGYYCSEIQAGRHVVRVGGSSDAKLEFWLEKDHEVFISFEPPAGFLGGHFYPVLVNREDAKEELKSKGYDIDNPVVKLNCIRM